MQAYGCKHEPPRDIVLLLDTSKSITPDSVRDEFKFAESLVDRMHRGDRLTIIPITGNAISETSGHVLYFIAPVHRETYDHDLVVFRQQAHEQIHAMRDAAIAHPSKRTDIFGALDLAKQVFEMDSREGGAKDRKKVLIVLSDFLEDDGTYRFISDKAMATDATAIQLAQQLQQKRSPSFGNIQIHAGGLASTDLGYLTPQRQQAIHAFWKSYLATIEDCGITESKARL